MGEGEEGIPEHPPPTGAATCPARPVMKIGASSIDGVSLTHGEMAVPKIGDRETAAPRPRASPASSTTRIYL